MFCNAWTFFLHSFSWGKTQRLQQSLHFHCNFMKCFFWHNSTPKTFHPLVWKKAFFTKKCVCLCKVKCFNHWTRNFVHLRFVYKNEKVIGNCFLCVLFGFDFVFLTCACMQSGETFYLFNPTWNKFQSLQDHTKKVLNQIQITLSTC